MGHNNREIEIKLTTARPGPTYGEVVAAVKALFRGRIEEVLKGQSADVYWHAPKWGRADFVRVRKLGGPSRGQITAKSCDLGDNFDRTEIDVKVFDVRQAECLLRETLGKPAGVVNKRYDVFFLEKKGKFAEVTNVSVYQVKGSSFVFVEVEGRSRRTVRALCGQLDRGLGLGDLVVVKSSLYDMFIRKKPMKKRSLTAELEELSGVSRARAGKSSKKRPRR